MGSGGSLTLWSPSNGAGAFGVNRCPCVMGDALSGCVADHLSWTVFKAVVDGGAPRFLRTVSSANRAIRTG